MFQNLISGVNGTGRLLAASTAGIIALGAVATATAQETSSDTIRPASIHTASCEAPGDVVAELGPLVVMFDDDDDDDDGSGSGGSTPPSNPGTGDDGTDDDGTDGWSGLTSTNVYQTSGGQFVGADDASVVEGSEDSNIGTTLDALVAEPHVIAVFESDGSDTIIACGSIGGFVSADDDNDLAVGLDEWNGSGFAGVALLDDDDDDNELDVDVYIARDVAAAD